MVLSVLGPSPTDPTPRKGGYFKIEGCLLNIFEFEIIDTCYVFLFFYAFCFFQG